MKYAESTKRLSRLVDEIFSVPTLEGILEIWSTGRPVARLTYAFAARDEKLIVAASDLWRAHRRWQLVSYVALLDAFDICQVEEFPLPDWLVEVCHTELVRAFEGRSQTFNLSASQVQNERKRLQQQKHFQIVYALEAFEDWKGYRGEPLHPHSRAYFPEEVHSISEEVASKLSSQRQRQKLASRCLPADGRVSNSFESIEKTFGQPKAEIGKRFDCIYMNSSYSNFCVWDISFLRASTEKSLNSLYYQYLMCRGFYPAIIVYLGEES